MMTAVINVLVSPAFFLAVLIYSLASFLISSIEIRLHDSLREVSLSHWLASHLGFPLLHSLAMILYVSLIYTHLYGFEGAPGIQELLNTGDERIQHLVNWVFLFALFIPMIPLIGPRLDIILPLQGLVVVFILGDWVSQYQGLGELDMIPATSYILPILFSGIIAAILTSRVTLWIGNWINERYSLSQSEQIIYPVLAIILHTPTLTLFAQGLMNRTP